MLDWGDLRFFLAVAERGSASAAARSLGVDKGTVSRRVSALERSVGVRLFDRKASGWSLTPAGRKALGPTRRVDAAISVMQTEIGGTSPEAREPVIHRDTITWKPLADEPGGTIAIPPLFAPI